MGVSFTEVPIPQRYLSAGLSHEDAIAKACFSFSGMSLLGEMRAGKLLGTAEEDAWMEGWRDQVCAGKLCWLMAGMWAGARSWVELEEWVWCLIRRSWQSLDMSGRVSWVSSSKELISRL